MPACLQTPEEERKRLLSFVVCGGGPTGVEVAAEMHDMIFDDLKVGGTVTQACGWNVCQLSALSPRSCMLGSCC